MPANTITSHKLEFLECSQADRLLAFAISISGREDGFPALLGASVRSRRLGVVDLVPQDVLHAGTLLCLVEHPKTLGDPDPHTSHLYSGEITFALWRDRTYQLELARIAWREWVYLTHYRVDPCTAAYGDPFELMQQRYVDKPHWIAHGTKER